MLKEILEKDNIIRYLLDRSNITKAQLDTYLINLLNINLKEKTLSRDEKNVSKGAFLRSLNQAETNIESAFYVIILMEYLGIFDNNNFINLIKIGDLLKDIKSKNNNNEENDSILFVIKSSIRNIIKKKSINM